MTLLRVSVPIVALAAGRAGDREIVVTAHEDATIRRWAAESGAALEPPVVAAEEARVLLLGGGRIYAAGPSEPIAGWDAVTGAAVPWEYERYADGALVLGRHRGQPVLFAVDGRYLRVLDADSGAVLTDFETGAWYGSVYHDNAGNAFLDERPGHDGSLRSLAFGRVDGEDLIATSDGDTQFVWSADQSGSAACWLRGDLGLTGEHLAFGTFTGGPVVANPHWRGDIWLHDPRTGHPVGEPLTGGPEPPTALGFGRLAGTDVLMAVGPDPVVRVWCTAGAPTTVLDLRDPPVALATSEETGHCYVATPTAVSRVPRG